MTTKYVTEGCVIDYSAGSTIASGQVLVVGTKVGVALTAIANGSVGSVQIAGVFRLAKLPTDVIGQGALVYWDTANSRLTTTSAGNTLAGVAYAAAGNGATTVDTLLNGVSC